MKIFEVGRLVGLVGGICFMAIAAASPTVRIADLMAGLRQSETSLGRCTGTLDVSVRRVRTSPVDLTSNAEAASSPDGSYRWFTHDSDWWVVKELPESSAALGPCVRLSVIRNYGSQVLTYSNFRNSKGRDFFGFGHLDRVQYLAIFGPMLGRRWTSGSFVNLLRKINNLKIAEEGDSIVVTGALGSGTIRMVIDRSHRFLVSELLLANQTFRSGYRIEHFATLGSTSFPSRVHLFNGEYQNGRLTKGSEEDIAFRNIRPFASVTPREVSTVPVGAMLGSDDDRVYRMEPSGKLSPSYGSEQRAVVFPDAKSLTFFGVLGLSFGALLWVVGRRKA